MTETESGALFTRPCSLNHATPQTNPNPSHSDGARSNEKAACLKMTSHGSHYENVYAQLLLWKYNSSNEAGATTWGSSRVDPQGGGMHRPHVLQRRGGGSRANDLTQKHSCTGVAHGPHPVWVLLVLVCFCFVLVRCTLFFTWHLFFSPIGV